MEEEYSNKVATIGVVCVFIGGFIGTMVGDGNFFITILFAIFGLLIGMVFGLLYTDHELNEIDKQAKEKYESEKPERTKKAKLAFYEECKKKRITNISSQTNRQKAELILNKSEYWEIRDSVDKVFNESKKLSEEKEDILHREELKELKNSERNLYNDYKKYADFYGRKKRVEMLYDIYNAYEEKISDYEKGQEAMMKLGAAMYQASQRKETSWATMGGIASGIAGPAAGLAVAMDIQAQNAEIRAQNQANGKNIIDSTVKYTSAIGGNIYDLQKSADAILEAIEDAEIKIVSNESAEEVFKYVKIKASNVKISETGSFIVKASASTDKKTIKVFNETEGIVDGTIAADLYQDNELVGTALLVLPVEGLNGSCKLEGMGLEGAKRNIPYEVKFRPYKLWIMEK